MKTSQSWLKSPRHPHWGFEEQQSDLLKVVIDLREPKRQPIMNPPPPTTSTLNPNLAPFFAEVRESRVSDSHRSKYFGVILTNFSHSSVSETKDGNWVNLLLSLVTSLFLSISSLIHFCFARS